METKFITAQKMEAIETENSIVGTASTQKMDRDKEIILSSAWKLDSYRKNPIIMLHHDYSSLPVGKAIWIKAVANEGLRFKCKFANTERGKEVFQLYQEGILNSFSVGFSPNHGGVIDNPTQKEYRGAKRLFTDVELLEISCVAIPANSDAMIERNESFVKYVKSGKVVCKELNNELEAIIEIIKKDESPIETKDDEINIEMKDEEDIEAKVTISIDGKEIDTIITKIESTDNFVHVPVPGEEGQHKDHKIRTTSISEKEGIQGKYCVNEKKMIGYVFDKKKFDEKAAVKWVEDHTKSFEIESSDEENELVIFKGLDVYYDEDGDVKFTDEIDTKEIEDIITKAKVTVDEDESKEEFMSRCMGAMSPKLPEKMRQNSCQMIWNKKEVIPEGIKEEIIEEIKETNPDETKAMMPETDEEMSAFMERCMGDAKMTSKHSDDTARTEACQMIWDEKNPKEIEEEDIETKISDEEIIKTLQDQLAELKCSTEAMNAKIVPSMTDSFTTKTVDAQGNPSLYDLTSAISNALNDPMNSTVVNPERDMNCYCQVVDIYATEYPNGHVVYSEHHRNECEFYQIDYIFDLQDRFVSLIDLPKPVLQTWVEDRYGEQENMTKSAEVVTKEGRVLSSANRQLLMDCAAQMQEAIAAVNALVSATEAVKKPVAAINVEDLFKETIAEEVKSPDELEIDDMVELDIEQKSIETFEVEDDDEFELDSDVIKKAIENAMSKVSKGIDVKGIVEEAVARRLGRAIL